MATYKASGAELGSTDSQATGPRVVATQPLHKALWGSAPVTLPSASYLSAQSRGRFPISSLCFKGAQDGP